MGEVWDRAAHASGRRSLQVGALLEPVMGESHYLRAEGFEVGELGREEEAFGLEPPADLGHGLAGDAYFLGDGVVDYVRVGDEALVDLLFDVGEGGWACVGLGGWSWGAGSWGVLIFSCAVHCRVFNDDAQLQHSLFPE